MNTLRAYGPIRKYRNSIGTYDVFHCIYIIFVTIH